MVKKIKREHAQQRIKLEIYMNISKTFVVLKPNAIH